jgi:hypothetical protein
VVSLALQPLYPLSRRLGGLQIQCGRFGEVTNFLLLLGFETVMVSLQPNRCADYGVLPKGFDRFKLLLSLYKSIENFT